MGFDMELRHLRYFLAVADELHFGRAADRLHIVQSALSRQIQDLEHYLNVKLFNRDSRNVCLTEAGTAFYEDAADILRKADRSVQRVRLMASGMTGRLRIGFVGNAGISGMLSGVLSLFREKYPDVMIDLTETESREQIGKLRMGELDIAIVTMIKDEGEFDEIPFFSSRWVIGIGSGHPLGSYKVLDGKQLNDERFIVYGDGHIKSRQVQLIRQITGNDSPAIAGYAKSTITTLTLVAAGYGIALLPETLDKTGVPGIAYIPINGLVCSSDIKACILKTETSPLVKNFRETLIACLASNRIRNAFDPDGT